MGSDSQARTGSPGSRWKRRWIAWRNRVIGSPAFQRRAATNPLTRAIARRRATGLFDLLAGFTYTQTLLATVESGLLDRLAEGPLDVSGAARLTGMSEAAAARLLGAAGALGLAERIEDGWWMLGEHGAALHANEGARAMILHHRLLYADLADPLALLRGDRDAPTALSRYWSYVERDDGDATLTERASAYSELMRASQAMVGEQVLAAVDLTRGDSLLDLGGGSGAFVTQVAARYPQLRLGIFDLPEVIRCQAAIAAPAEIHAGDFFADPIPSGYAWISLVRILHDHDDEAALALLGKVRAALAPGARLLIAEPMAGTPGARRMGDAYFGLYLWAMRSGRPRTCGEIGAMLDAAGFARWRAIATPLPVVASVIVASA